MSPPELELPPLHEPCGTQPPELDHPWADQPRLPRKFGAWVALVQSVSDKTGKTFDDALVEAVRVKNKVVFRNPELQTNGDLEALYAAVLEEVGS